VKNRNTRGTGWILLGILLILTVFVVRTVEQKTPTALHSSALSSATSFEPIDLNTATKAQLKLLPGIGDTLAERILDYRATYGSFTEKENLLEIQGISEKIFEQIKDEIVIGSR